jgi:hypothetical protein
MTPPSPFQSEMTPDGEQTLIRGVRPITMRDRLDARMEVPLTDLEICP